MQNNLILVIFITKLRNRYYSATLTLYIMIELTVDEKMEMLAEANKLLDAIPDYDVSITRREIEYEKILLKDEGYILHLDLEYGDVFEKPLGKTHEEAVMGLAHECIETYAFSNVRRLYPEEKGVEPRDKIHRFIAYCNSFIDKSEK